MKTLLSTLLLLAVAAVSAQSVSFSAKTGDSELDVTLSELNTSASADMAGFKVDMVRTYGIAETKITDLEVNFGMQAGDIFMTLEIAKLTKKPITDVAAAFKTNKDKGWGEIAKQLGIKLGSTEFHALKASAKEKKAKAKGKENAKKNVKPVDKGKTKTK